MRIAIAIFEGAEELDFAPAVGGAGGLAAREGFGVWVWLSLGVCGDMGRMQAGVVG